MSDRIEAEKRDYGGYCVLLRLKDQLNQNHKEEF